MPTQQVVNNTSTQTTLTTTAGTVTTSPTTQTVSGYSTLQTSTPFFSASMVGGIITVRNPEIITTGLTAGKNNLIYPASQIGEITNVYSSITGQTRKLSGSYDFSILMVQNSTTARVAQVGGFKNANDDTLGSFSVLLAKKPDDGTQWTAPPTNIDYYDTYLVNSFSATNNFTASYIQPLVVTQTENSSSFADIILSNIEPATGDVYKVKTLYKPSGQFGDFIDLGDTILERQDILIDTQSFETGVTVGSYYENFGVYENLLEIQTYWTGSKVGPWQAGTNLSITYDMDTLMGGARLKPTDTSFSFTQAAVFAMKPAYNQRVYKDTEYIVTFNIANDPDIATYTHNSPDWFDNPRLDIYVSGSKITRSEDAFLNVLANGASLLSNFNSTFNTTTLKQIDGGLGTRIGTYITKPIPETITTCTFRFKALEDASINLKFVIRYGAFIISDIHVYANKETGFSPNYARINKRIPTEHLNTPLTFKFQYFDRFGRQANLESVAYGAVFDGDNTYIDGTNNLITGSVFISNQIGSGLELAGVNSGFMRSVGYEGFISASDPTKGGAPGWMIFSGSVLPQSGDNYGGVGLELIADADNYLKYRTFPQSIFIVKAESFFLGASNNYISGSNGKLEISSSNFILSRNGDVFVKGDINADTGTFKDVDIRGKISTFRVSGSSTTSPVSGLTRVMLEPWYMGTGTPASTYYPLTLNTYVSKSVSNLKTRLPWKIPTNLWDPDAKTESIPNRIATASYGAVPAKQMDFEYNYSHDSTLYGLTSGYPYDNGLAFGYQRNITWNQSTGSWCGIRLENVRITPATSANQDEMSAKPDYVLMVGFSAYVGVELRVIIKRGSTTITSYTYTDEFDTHEYVTRTGEHVTLRIPLGAQSSYRSTATGYNPVNPRVDIEIQWRNSGYRGVTAPTPSTDVTARFIALHELKILELPRVDNLAVRNLRIGDPFRSSVIFDVVGSNLIGTNGGAEPSMVTLRNTAFNVTQSKGYHDLKLRNLEALGTVSSKGLLVSGSVNITGSTTQRGNNRLFGNTTLSGSIIISGAYGTNNPSVRIFGDTQHNGYVRFDPVSTNINNSISASYIYVSGSTNDLYFSQNGAGYTNTTRLRWLEGNLYTGLLHGGVISATVGGTTFNISSGSGIIVNLNASLSKNPYPTIKYVNWGNYNNQTITYRTTAVQTFLGIDDTGQIIQQTAPWYDGQYNTSISLGTVIHQNKSTVNAAINYPNTAYGYKQRTYDFIKAFGPLKLSGYTLATSSSLGLTVGSGSAFADGRNYQIDPNNPSFINDNGTAVSKIFRYYQSASAFVEDTNLAAGYTGLDTTKYNPNGVGILSSVSPSKFYVQRIFWYPRSATKGIVSYYGLSPYDTLDEAQTRYINEPFLETPNTQQNAIFLGIVIIKGNSNFNSANDYRIVQGGLFRSTIVGGSLGGNVTSLTSLSDTSIITPSSGDLLVYTGSLWRNAKRLNGSYTVSGSLCVTGSITVKGNILPGGPYTANTSSFNLGSPTQAWKDIYVSNGSVKFISGSTVNTISMDARGNIKIPNVALTGSLLGTAATASFVNRLRQNVILTGSMYIGANTSAEAIRITQTGTGLALRVEDSANPDVTPFVIDQSGNVGIGTVSPQYSIVASASSGVDTVMMFDGGTAANANLVARADTSIKLPLIVLSDRNNAYSINTSYYIGLDRSGSGVTPAYAKRNDVIYVNNYQNKSHHFITNNGGSKAVRMTISGSGNVGIGTVNPQYKLDINGNTGITGKLVATSDITASIFAATNNGNGTNFKVGDDAWIGDINIANTLQVKGIPNSNRAYIKFGDGVSNPTLGANNSSTLSLTGTLDATGPINIKFVQGVLSGDQSINNATDTVIQFIDQYDTNGWLTSNQFKPTIAGYYEVHCNVLLESPGVSNNQANIQMRLNGSTQVLIQQVLNSVTNQTLSGTKIIYLNGSTDYVDFTVYHGSGATKKLLQGAAYQGTWFTAKLISS